MGGGVRERGEGEGRERGEGEGRGRGVMRERGEGTIVRIAWTRGGGEVREW